MAGRWRGCCGRSGWASTGRWRAGGSGGRGFTATRWRMETLVGPAEQRTLLYDISWETYERLLVDLAESGGTRLTYDTGTLEIMSPLPEHEELRHNLATLVEIVVEARDLDLLGLG